MIRPAVLAIISAFTLMAQAPPMVHAPPQINTTTLWYLVFRAQTISAQIRKQGNTPELVKQISNVANGYAVEMKKLERQCGYLYTVGFREDPKVPFAGQIICKPKPSAGMNAFETAQKAGGK